MLPREVRALSAIAVAVAVAVAGGGAVAHAQTQVKGRVMVMVDTSGSMVWHFGDCATTKGDSGGGAVFCDNNLGTQFACSQNAACTLANGGIARFPTTLGNPSRLYAAKSALNDVIFSAAGALEFGLEKYAVNSSCPDGNNCCITRFDSSTQGRCVSDTDYAAVAPNKANITVSGGCGTSENCVNCQGTQGGKILVYPGAGSSGSVLPFIDGVEDFCSSTNNIGGAPRNPELRAAGPTPLAGSIRTARLGWYQKIYDASHGGNCDPTQDAFCDPQIDCRQYVNVVMTDGNETCEASSQWFTDPQKAVGELTAVNPKNPVKTYVIGMSFAQNESCNNTGADDANVPCPKNVPCVQQGNKSFCGCTSDADCGRTCDGYFYTCGNDGICHHPSLGSLNAMAQAGGTDHARFANNQLEIETAFADIVNASVKYEVCNGVDDNCNGLVDEGLGVFQECTQGIECQSGKCAGGRCACNGDGQCSQGNVCAAGLCVPSCTVGIGVCQKSGVRKCSGPKDTACCVNDGLATCTPLVPGQPQPNTCNGLDNLCTGIIDTTPCSKCTPTAETCNGKDDDCDGIVDNHLVDTGKPCGLNLGVCKPGLTACVPDGNKPFPDGTDHLVCQGGVGPSAPACNGCDNSCTGVVDKPTEHCYGGPAGTEGVGLCTGGQHQCLQTQCGGGPSFGACVGEIRPTKEICNGLDDDCNGVIDDVQGSGGDCCPSGKCGTGQCKVGKLVCSGGVVQCVGAVGPSPEVCDGVDNDCNGMVDDVVGVGKPCTEKTVCNGMLACDIVQKALVCKGGAPSPEVCNGIDDDCDGIVDNADKILVNDKRLQKACGPDPCDKGGQPVGECRCGMTICQGGAVVCGGAVFPTAPVCDGKDHACVGNTDGPCPTDFFCYMGGCYQKCKGMAEFGGCPGGYTCDAHNFCVPDTCLCGQCQKCKGNMCVDACTGVTCQPGHKCECGSCVDDSCISKGCPTGQLCDKAKRACVADPCLGVTCGPKQFCDPHGACVDTCIGVTCNPGQRCVRGVCGDDKCLHRACAEGQLCDPKSGACVKDPCAGKQCVEGLVCVDGDCVQNPCDFTRCPATTTCQVASLGGEVNCDATPTKPALAKEEIVGAGGGGCACALGGDGAGGGRGRAGNGAAAPGFLASVLVVGWLGRRRRRRLRSGGEEA